MCSSHPLNPISRSQPTKKWFRIVENPRGLRSLAASGKSCPALQGGRSANPYRQEVKCRLVHLRGIAFRAGDRRLEVARKGFSSRRRFFGNSGRCTRKRQLSFIAEYRERKLDRLKAAGLSYICSPLGRGRGVAEGGLSTGCCKTSAAVRRVDAGRGRVHIRRRGTATKPEGRYKRSSDKRDGDSESRR